jgi:hypothetical protein
LVERARGIQTDLVAFGDVAIALVLRVALSTELASSIAHRIPAGPAALDACWPLNKVMIYHALNDIPPLRWVERSVSGRKRQTALAQVPQATNMNSLRKLTLPKQSQGTTLQAKRASSLGPISSECVLDSLAFLLV